MVVSLSNFLQRLIIKPNFNYFTSLHTSTYLSTDASGDHLKSQTQKQDEILIFDDNWHL